MRDLLPEEALAHRRVESAMSHVMESWGYVRVIPATIRFREEVAAGPGASIEARTYKFADRRGRVLSLRPDMTTPVAAMVAGGGWALPAKVYYSGSVFRIEGDRSGRPHEFLQVGAEIFGVAGAWADAEIVALCVECLKAAGIRAFRIGLGNVGATRSLLERAGLGDGALAGALEALQRRDIVSFERVALTAGVSRAGVASLRDSLRPVPVDEISDPFPGWNETLEALRGFGIEGAVCVDMGIVRDMSYYTGTVFEVYGKGVGRAAGGGGRYDGLMSRLGVPQPATGFALNVPEVVEMMRAQGSVERDQPLTLVVATDGSASQAG
ncbi:MAG: ATP phosphoribosyltransferase regulatory subunit, partial [Bacillota bacterium]